VAKRFLLVSDADWKNWWAAVSKKLRKDPWFDASIKNRLSSRGALSETGISWIDFCMMEI